MGHCQQGAHPWFPLLPSAPVTLRHVHQSCGLLLVPGQHMASRSLWCSLACMGCVHCFCVVQIKYEGERERLEELRRLQAKREQVGGATATATA